MCSHAHYEETLISSEVHLHVEPHGYSELERPEDSPQLCFMGKFWCSIFLKKLREENCTCPVLYI